MIEKYMGTKIKDVVCKKIYVGDSRHIDISKISMLQSKENFIIIDGQTEYMPISKELEQQYRDYHDSAFIPSPFKELS